MAFWNDWQRFWKSCFLIAKSYKKKYIKIDRNASKNEVFSTSFFAILNDIFNPDNVTGISMESFLEHSSILFE
jgi:hypothetical protein